MNIEVWKLLLPFALGVGTLYFVWRKFRIDVKDRKDREEAALREARKEAPPAPQPLRTNVTLRPDRPVLGREADLERLRTILTWDKTVAVIVGQGGLGKSTLAREYANRHQREHRGIWWIGAETEEGRVDGYFDLGVELGLASDVPGERRDVAKAALNRLRGDGAGWLVVLDNAHDHAAVREWLPLGGGAQVIVTTRSGGWPGAFRTVESGTLPFTRDNDPAVAVLMEAAERTDDREGARILAEALGGLPLALVVAGGWLRDAKGTSFAAYAAKLEAVLTQAPPGDYPDTLLKAVKLSYDALGEDARAVLDLFAHLAPEGLEARLISDLPGAPWIDGYRAEIPERVHALSLDAAGLDEALGQLCRLSLLQRAEGGFALHRMTAAAVRTLQGEARPGQAAAAAVLAAQYPFDSDEFHTWPDCARLTPHVAALFDRGDSPASAAMDWLLSQAAGYLEQQAEHDRAVDFARAALDMKALRLPAGHREIAIGHSVLGHVLLAAGRLDEAEREQAENVRLSAAVAGEPAKLATAWNNHGGALEGLGRRAEAARRYQQALALACATFGPQHELVAGAVSNLARVRDALGQRALALALAGKALRLHRANLAGGDPRMAVDLNNLGAMLLEYGAADRAEPLLAEALTINREAYGREDHPNVVGTARWLRSCLLARAAAGEDRAGREARARALAAAHGFDVEEERRVAAALPYRPGVDPLEGYVYKPPPDRAANLPSNYFRSE